MYKYIWIKEIKSLFYTWKSLAWLLITSIIFSVTSYLFLTNKELSLLDQTEMLWLFGKIIIGSTLLVVVIDTATLIASEFENETMEDLILTPLTLKDFVLGKILYSLTLWALIYVVAAPYMIVTSAGSSLTLAFFIYIAILGMLVILGFTMFVFALSFLFKSVKNTLTASLTVLFALSIPALFSTALKKDGVARTIGIINPVDNVFSALDNVLVDYHFSISQNLSYLIPLTVFCFVMFIALSLSLRKFKKEGIINTK